MAKKVITTIRYLSPSTKDVLRCGMGTQPAGSCQENFLTTEYAMLYMVEGRATYVDDDHKAIPIKAGDVWQRLPNVVHSVFCHEPCMWHHVAVPAAVIPLLEVAGIDTIKPIVFHIGKHPQIIRRYEQVRRRLHDGPQSQLPYSMMAMQQLMIDMHQLAKSAGKDEEDHWLDRARQLLGQNLDQRIATENIADHLGMTYASFRKKFTQATGTSPGQYRIRLRLQQAQEQLAGSHLSIADIAQNLGYPDVYSFNTQFARHMGLPPGQYRKQWQWDNKA
ncbi:MAG: helix-turn-helix domain-containing protein [Phycisphaeraceae bacterium JB051]